MAAVPLDEAAVRSLMSRVQHDVERGLAPAAQVALAREGRVEVFEAFGTASTSDRLAVFSCTKALVAAAVWTLFDSGLLERHGRVCDVVPDFTGDGKELVEVEHLLVHTAGFPGAPMAPEDWGDRQRRVARMADWHTETPPGTRFEYHPTSAHWVLAELIERVCGRSHPAAIHERVTEPLGLPKMLGIPTADQDGICEVVLTGEPPTAEDLEALGMPGLAGTSLGSAEITDTTVRRFNEPATREVGVPGGGGVASAADLAMLYQALLHDPGGMWSDEVLGLGTRERLVTMTDPMTGVAANRTLGLIVAGDDGQAVRRGFCNETSPLAFGHSGIGGQLAWADPASGLSFCFLTSGLDANLIRASGRGVKLSTLAATSAN